MNRQLTPRRSSGPFRLVVVAAMAAIFLTGCPEPFEVETPSSMVELSTSDDRTYVAMTHDNVVVRARVMRQGDDYGDTPQASGEFWTDAIRERMRLNGGYELLEEQQVESDNGHEGTRLEFGRDQEGEPYRYWMTLFVTDHNIHLIEAGGRGDRFESATEDIEELLSSYTVHR